MNNNYQEDDRFNSSDNEQETRKNNLSNQKSPKKGVGTKTLILLVSLAGLLGGACGGSLVYFINNQNQTIKTSSGKTTEPTKVSNVVIKENSGSEKAFNKVKGAVVSVINLQKEQPVNSLFGGIFGGQRGRSDKGSGSLQESSEGSGVIYKKDNGQAYVVTNNHVVAGSDKLEIILSDGSKVNAKLLGTDSVTDLAVLQIDSGKVSTVASFGNSNEITPGQQVLAIGSPMGSKFATSVTQGIVSAKSRTIDVTDEDTGQATGQATVIQTDAAINPGNSGGALINIGGQVIGITSMKLSGGSNSSTSVEGMGFAIPSNEVVQIVNQLEKNGKVARPALGISPVDLSDVSSTQQSSVLHIPSSVKSGVVVVSLTNNSPAAKAGVKQYDVIYQIEGTKVDSVVDLRTQLFKYQIGDTINLSLYRGSQKMDVKVKLTETAKQEITTKQGQN